MKHFVAMALALFCVDVQNSILARRQFCLIFQDFLSGKGRCDNGTDIEFGKPYELNGPDNPGNLKMPKAFTGRVQLTVAGGKYVLLLDAAEPETPGLPSGIYLRGDMNGWGTDVEFKTTEFKNIWIVENVTIAEGESFKVADATWGAINYGGADEPFEFDKTYTLTLGGSNITCAEAFTGNVKLQLQGGAYKLTLITI